jgi:hypothetical protein
MPSELSAAFAQQLMAPLRRDDPDSSKADARQAHLYRVKSTTVALREVAGLAIG